ncbi:MAG: sensor histidine kinase, partial [Planctomycetales bacterium]|nr:sensor histidine kinase [Planctomycetales bacterium]
MSAATPTKGRDLERQVAELQDRVARLQRLTAIGELMGATTHEFNNILTTIINYAQLGIRNKGDDAARDKAFDRILAAGRRAAKITGGVLAMARNRSPELAPTDLERIIDDSLLLLEREMIKHRVKVERRIETDRLAIAGGNEIQQVLMNLLVNARQAMTGGGRIVVRLAYREADDMIELAVRDDGPGMPREQLVKIFEPFYSTKSGPDDS